MKLDRILAAALLVLACADVRGAAVSPAAVQAPLPPSLPPQRVSDCITFALLDDKCTADWYRCVTGATRQACRQSWEECCTLHGQGARSKLGMPEQVSSNR